jgi:flagellar protein FliS
MSASTPALAYRRAATQHASTVGLVVALYDTLIGDLQRAAAAMHQEDIAERSLQIKHGFAVLTQLNTLVDPQNGGATAVQLTRFYEHLRREMLRAQFVRNAAILEQAALLVMEVREAWQEVEARGGSTGEASLHSSTNALGLSAIASVSVEA